MSSTPVYQGILLFFICEVLKVFYTSILEAYGRDDSSQNGCQGFLNLVSLAWQKMGYVYSAVHIQAAVQVWNKVDPSLFPMALQNGNFHTCSHSFSIETLVYWQNNQK